MERDDDIETLRGMVSRTTAAHRMAIVIHHVWSQGIPLDRFG